MQIAAASGKVAAVVPIQSSPTFEGRRTRRTGSRFRGDISSAEPSLYGLTEGPKECLQIPAEVMK
jgi:hypothetical protein